MGKDWLGNEILVSGLRGYSQVTDILSALSITGAVLNVKKMRSGFAIWILTNGAWVLISVQRGNYSEAVMWATYLALSVWGLFDWRTK